MPEEDAFQARVGIEASCGPDPGRGGQMLDTDEIVPTLPFSDHREFVARLYM